MNNYDSGDDVCCFSVEEVMNNLGWRRVRDKSDDTVRLRWCELKSTINYSAFKEGLCMLTSSLIFCTINWISGSMKLLQH